MAKKIVNFCVMEGIILNKSLVLLFKFSVTSLWEKRVPEEERYEDSNWFILELERVRGEGDG